MDFSVLWKDGRHKGEILADPGLIDNIAIQYGSGHVSGMGIDISVGARLNVSVGNAVTHIYAGATIISVKTVTCPFSFFFRDISREYPIYIPEYGVIVTETSDQRTYSEIEDSIKSKSLSDRLAAIAQEPEDSYESATEKSVDVFSQVWLGVARDVRLFAVSLRSRGRYLKDVIRPRYHSRLVFIPELDYQPIGYHLVTGRGHGVVQKASNRLMDGWMPVVESEQIDEDICYKKTVFTAYDSGSMMDRNNTGTDFEDFEEIIKKHNKDNKALGIALDEYFSANESRSTAAYVKIEAVNTALVPRYSWVSCPCPTTYPPVIHYQEFWTEWPLEFIFDSEKGFGKFNSGRVFCTATVNGEPMRHRDTGILLKPGESAVYIFKIPHSPVTEEKAEALAMESFDDKLKDCREYWLGLSSSAGRISLPEKTIDNMINAGLAHLEITNYGREPEGSIAATVGGIYGPIGTETAPILMFLDSLGLHGTVERALEFFLDAQTDDGVIKLHLEYMAEVGGAMFMLGEHFRYTKDLEWLSGIKEKILKTCGFITRWINKNRDPERKGRGYGMVDGPVADTYDFCKYFMLNAFTFAGLKNAAGMLSALGAPEAGEYIDLLREFGEDIRKGFYETMASSPAIPLGDGTWSPTVPAWAENRSLTCFDPAGDQRYCYPPYIRDSLLGPLWLVFLEVLDPKSPEVDFVMRYNTDVMSENNVGFCQPYYSRHPEIHLMRGEIKAFIKAYYNHVPGHIDRETYTFWENPAGYASPHKTHEEAWFLMQTRVMLYKETENSLELLKGVPRAWLEDGKEIVLDGVKSYFGEISLKVRSAVSSGNITAEFCCDGKIPGNISIRLPHPEGKKAKSVAGGKYDSEMETVSFEQTNGMQQIKLEF